MLTNHYRRFFIVLRILIEDDGYMQHDEIVLKYYGRQYVKRLAK